MGSGSQQGSNGRRSARESDIVGDARRVADDAASMVRDAKRVGTDLRQMITERPLRALGTAAGAGFVVGGGLSPAVLRSLTALAGRLAMVVVTRRLIAVLDQRAEGNAPRRSPSRRGGRRSSSQSGAGETRRKGSTTRSKKGED